ncbi:ABC transporter permease [Paeniglutamicibacter gangotriensis]|uniref:Binding-protein-dependent transport system inner membrane protein n=1 Tax=Paeniglutamicibacter gangotriensis Lz1y TaxID=1276920 RepID=M7MP23_9MICC|nr:ABC transporter permease [Paeniglutamicibacter gangotriensis]EMQ96756.1 binding-protein-dependent transport system inner membrane protein [Paeniglutamicibacter gangotriensis Lz1y]
MAKSINAPRRYSVKSPLIGYLLRRFVTSILLLIGVTIVTFTLTNLVPGNPVAAALGEGAASNPDTVAAYVEKYGLDKPLPMQYLTYVGNLLQGDMGTSLHTRQPVADDLVKAVPATVEVALASIVVSLAVGTALGAVAAYRRGRLSDQLVRVLSLIGLSIPTFWMALTAFNIFFLQLGIAPGSGRLSPIYAPPPSVTGLYTVDTLLAGQWESFVDVMAHLMLPVFVLSLFTIGLLTRFVRTSVLEVLDADYVRAGRAKGLGGSRMLFGYVLRGASLPILTIVGIAFGSLLSGTVLVEAVFAWPGLGTYAYLSATSLDLPGIMGVGLVVGVIYLGINFIVDMLYGVLDPRARLA